MNLRSGKPLTGALPAGSTRPVAALGSGTAGSWHGSNWRTFGSPTFPSNVDDLQALVPQPPIVIKPSLRCRCCKVAAPMVVPLGSVMSTGRRACVTIVVVTALAIFFAIEAASQSVGSKSGELKIFATRSIATVLEKIGADFERRTGRTLSVTTDGAVRLVRRINAASRSTSASFAACRSGPTC
jgi:hypothetical protein